MLRVENVHGGYGQVRILHGVDLTLDKGEIVTVLGANGSGKSTLMKAIAGVVRSDVGRIELNGRELTALLSHERADGGLSFVPQSRNAFASLTVHENLQLAAERFDPGAYGLAFEVFPQLAEYRNRRAGHLSGGGRQMLGIAMGLLAKPTLLILDEPTAALSPKMADIILDTVATKIKPRGIAVLMVEQRVREALTITDRVYVMAQGKVVKTGAARDFGVGELAELFLAGRH